MQCSQCQYALDGLAPDGVCPECGLAIQETARRNRPTRAGLSLRTFGRGLAFTIAGVGLLTTAYVLGVAVMADIHPSAYWTEEGMSAFFFVGPVSIGCFVLFLIVAGISGCFRLWSTWIIVLVWIVMAAVALCLAW